MTARQRRDLTLQVQIERRADARIGCGGRLQPSLLRHCLVMQHCVQSIRPARRDGRRHLLQLAMRQRQLGHIDHALLRECVEKAMAASHGALEPSAPQGVQARR
jgi:hypothetical protein